MPPLAEITAEMAAALGDVFTEVVIAPDFEPEALELLASENPLTDDTVLTEALARVLFVVELIGEDSARQELDA